MTTKTQQPQSEVTTDRIEKRIVLHAPRSRVWRAISNAQEFGTWFRMRFDGPFAAGTVIRGQITHPGYEHVVLDIEIERMEAERYFSYRWHPYAIDPKTDYSAEPTTLVEFTLEDAEDGTAVTIVESGFDRIPLGRRDEAFRMNDKGWGGQIQNLARHVA